MDIGHPLGKVLVALAGARQLWLWAAGGAFAAALVCSAGAWRSALASCGSRIGRLDTVARYSVGSLVNSLLPAHAGGAARIALFSQAIRSEQRIWTAGGVAAAIGVARAVVLALLVLIAWGTGALPLWPVLALIGVGAGAAAICLAVRRRRTTGRLSHLLDAFRAFGRSPRDASTLLAWVAASSAARIAAAAAIAAAIGVGAPFTTALIVVPALALAGVVQVTPANVGTAGATVTFALRKGRRACERARGRTPLPGNRNRRRARLGLDGRSISRLPFPHRPSLDDCGGGRVCLPALDRLRRYSSRQLGVSSTSAADEVSDA